MDYTAENYTAENYTAGNYTAGFTSPYGDSSFPKEEKLCRMLAKVRAFQYLLFAPTLFGVEARTSLDPFLRFNLTVAVEVGTQVTMSADTTSGIIPQ